MKVNWFGYLLEKGLVNEYKLNEVLLEMHRDISRLAEVELNIHDLVFNPLNFPVEFKVYFGFFFSVVGGNNFYLNLSACNVG